MNRVAQVSSQLFFRYNTALGPPYRVLIDTNFINFSIQNKLDIFTAMMDCLLAKCIPMVTDCVLAELEKLGQKYRGSLWLLTFFSPPSASSATLSARGDGSAAC